MATYGDGRSTARLPYKDILALAAIAVFATVTFLPWAYDTALAGIGIVAWLMAAAMVLFPVIGLISALTERDEAESDSPY